MKRLIAMLALVVIPSVANAGEIRSDVFDVTDDSTDGTIFYIGSLAGVKGDWDTSKVYDCPWWDDLTFSSKSTAACWPDDCGSNGDDSAAVAVIVQVSNDELYWYPLDSLLVVDSLAGFKDVAWQKWRKARFVIHHHTKSSETGSRCVVTAHAWGREE